MQLKPIGDSLNDGAVQLSFTLALDDSESAREAARLFVLKLGFESCQIVNASGIADGFTMFVAYGRTKVGVDLSEVEVDPGLPGESMSFEAVNEFIARRIGRKLVVVGAATGYDAHTVGIDAIMNMKGYDHHFGLERYPMIEAVNLGSQVSNEELIKAALEAEADAILVSQIVTQRDVHIKNLKELISLLHKTGLGKRLIVIAGGPRISHKLATELGFDAGFGQGTYAEDVATFIAVRIVERDEK